MCLERAFTIAAVVAIIAAGGVIGFLALIEPNDYRHEIAATLQDAAGRAVTLGGTLSLEKSQTPTMVVQDVPIANASWSRTPEMASIKTLEVEVEVELLPLLSNRIVVNSLVLQGGSILLESDSQGHANVGVCVGHARCRIVPEDTTVSRLQVRSGIGRL